MRNQLTASQAILNENSNIKFLEPPYKLRKQALVYEKELMRLYNIIPDEDMIYEDVILDKEQPNYYIHTLRTKIIDPNKPHFIFVHGFIGSSTNFMALCPFLLKKYNLFIPDTIGMALSCRPQIKFTSNKQCTDFFIDNFEKWRRILNINKFYLAGHSLGGYFVSAYALKFPNDVLKLLLLSPAGITNPKKCCEIHKHTGYCKGCGLRLLAPFWCREPRFQQLYNCCCLKPIIKCSLRYRYETDKRISELMAKLTEIAMEYPEDIDRCMWYVFTNPFPLGANPLEEKLLKELKIKIVICFGEKDWMDQAGSWRLMEKNKERFLVKIVSKFGHTFMIENPKELSEIILSNFE